MAYNCLRYQMLRLTLINKLRNYFYYINLLVFNAAFIYVSLTHLYIYIYIESKYDICMMKDEVK